ncbi:unnamed protein product [Ceutorhynchus assimilis]|uniref:Uncharacterized protein n=1 Tax=Ceutorhynchus assimilis TaxID=467358 RepID=A0A9N9QMN8_9CUCU|nr:unnamed protein product [Ceutorhynchus assimilis]
MNSPLAKRVKMTSRSTFTYEDHRDKICEMIRCRKLALKHIETYCKAKKIDLERIMSTAVRPERSIDYEIPEIDESIVSEPESFTKEIEEATEDCKELIMLLNIEEQKRKCPISKIVDEIKYYK